MKNFVSGSVCIALALICSAAQLGAQQPPAAAPQAGAPAQAQPPEPEEAPGAPEAGVTPSLPEPEKYTEEQMPGERGLTLGVTLWPATSKTWMYRGETAATSHPGDVFFKSERNTNRGLEMAYAVGLHNALRFTYFDMRGAGNLTADGDIDLWNRFYPKGTYIDAGYRVKNFKLVFEYLTWPFPVKTSRFRLKTLWGVQYTAARTSFDAPLLPLLDEDGLPLVDEAGNPVAYQGEGSQFYFLPILGVAAQSYITPRFSIEGAVSGFAIPGHTYTWDAEAAANVRVRSLEFRFGFKSFGFRTSPGEEFYLQGQPLGPFIGLRWHSDSYEPSRSLR